MGHICFYSAVMGKSRVLITGATGLLGRAIRREFLSCPDWEILSLGFSRHGEGITKLDLTNADETRRVIKKFQPSIIIHAAAERRPNKVEQDKEAARRLNVGSTGLLAKIVDELNHESSSEKHCILFVSTDYVFDGKAAPYKTTDTPNPLNEYGRHKLEGEKMLAQHCPDGIILRVPVLYGETKDLKESAVTVLFDLVRLGNPVTTDNYHKRYPTLTDDVAKVCRLICEERMKDPSLRGIWHWSGPDCTTKYEMAKTMAEMYGLSHQHISPANHPPPSSSVTRPYNTALDTSELESKLKFSPPKTHFTDGIKKVLDDFQ